MGVIEMVLVNAVLLAVGDLDELTERYVVSFGELGRVECGENMLDQQGEVDQGRCG